MNYIQLFINDPATAELDLNQEIDIALQYSIAEITDVSKRNAAYSKTIILPGTKTNNYWFGNLFDVNADFTMFNPNKKTSARLLVNTETVIDGFLQLRKIVKLNNVDSQGNLINYEVVIFNNSVDLMSVIGENPVNELDLSQFGHTFSAQNIKDSWNNEWQDGYVYPMFGLHTKDNQYKVEYFYPAIFYKTLLDQMIRGAGFGWTGSLWSNEQFEKEIISFVSDGRPKLSDNERLERLYYVGLSPSNLNLFLGEFPNFGGYNNLQIPITNLVGGWTFQFADEVSGGFFDNGNNWNATTYQWVVNNTGDYDCSYNLSYNFNVRNTHPSTTVAITEADVQVKFEHFLQYSTNGGSTWTNWDVSTQYKSISQSTIAPGSSASCYVYVGRQAPQITLSSGTIVRLRWKAAKVNLGWWAGTGGNSTPKLNAYLDFKTTNGGNWIKNDAKIVEFTQNQYIDLGRYLPDKIKQKDLLTDLIRRYNLYIQTDADNPKLLIFDTRPDFYEKGIILDWTDKKDYSQRDEISLLSDLQSKLMIWSYKPDSDEYNKLYSEYTGDIYGQYKYYYDNDFVIGEEKIESPFSPTPLVKTPFNAIVAGINPEIPKVAPRVLYWGGLRNCDSWSWAALDPITGLTGATESFSQYPYAGHFDNPVEPSIDINFGTCKYYFYNDWEFITDNNMFNTYWSDYNRQIESGRLITSYFYLNEYDIRFIKDNFYTKIFVLDSYYYINKIVDYKPLQYGTTKVELIKIVDGIKWEAKRNTSLIASNPISVFNNLSDLVVAGSGNVSSGGGILVGSNNIAGGKTEYQIGGFTYSGLNKFAVIGNDNNLAGDKSMIIGNSNIIESDFSSIISGDSNVVKTSNAFIANGSRNTIDSSATSLILGGNDNIIEVSGSTSATGSAPIIIGGNNNVISSITGSVILIGTNGITQSSENTVYIGNNFQIDIDSGSYSGMNVFYTEDVAGSSASLIIPFGGEQYWDINGVVTQMANRAIYVRPSEVKIKSGITDYSQGFYYGDEFYNEVYDNSTAQTVAWSSIKNIMSDGYTNLQAIGTTLPFNNRAFLKLDPSMIDTGTTFKQETIGSTETAEIKILGLSGSQTIFMDVYDGISNNSQIDLNQYYVLMTPDANATWLYLEAGRFNLKNVPSTASNPGDIWKDANNFLRIVP